LSIGKSLIELVRKDFFGRYQILIADEQCRYFFAFLKPPVRDIAMHIDPLKKWEELKIY